MNQDNGQINFTLGLDDDSFQRQLERDAEQLNKTGDAAEAAGKRIDTAFEQAGKSADESAHRIDEAFEQVGAAADKAGQHIEDMLSKDIVPDFGNRLQAVRDMIGQTTAYIDKMGSNVDERVPVFARLIQTNERFVSEHYKYLQKQQGDLQRALADGNDEAVQTAARNIKDAKKQIEEAFSAIESNAKAIQGFANVKVKTPTGSTASLRAELRQVTQELANAIIKYRVMSDAEKETAQGRELVRHIEELTNKAGQLRDAMDDANQAIKGTASDTANFDAVAQGLNVITSSAGAAEGALSMLGVSQEELMDIQTKLQASLAISNALSVIQNSLQKQSALMLGVRRVQEWAATKAIQGKTAAELESAIATGKATAAQRLFNMVAKANPYVLLGSAILSVVGAFALFASGSKEVSEAERRQKEETDKLAQAQADLNKAIGGAVGGVMGQYKLLQAQWKQLSSSQEKNRWIDENKSKFNQMGLAVKDIVSAEKAFVDNSAAVINALKARAEAEAWGEIYKERVKKKHENDSNGNVGNGRYRYVYSQGQEMTLGQVEDVLGRDLSRVAGGALDNGAYLGTSGVHFGTRYGRNDKVLLSASAAADMNQAAIERQNKLLDDEAKGIEEAEEKMVESQRAAVEAQKAIADLIPQGGTGGNTRNDPKASAEAQKRAQEQYLSALEKAKQAYLDQDVELEEDAELKWLNKMALTHSRKLAEIEREQRELLQAKQAAYGNNAALTSEELKIFKDRLDAENLLYQRVLDERLKAAADKEKADMQQYLIEYGTYQERLNAIHEKYKDLRGKATTEGEKMSLGKQEEAEIETLNQRFGYATQAMADLFADASQKSVKEIQKIIDKYEALIKFMQGQKTADMGGSSAPTVTTDQLKGLGFSDEDIKKVQSGEIRIKDLTDAIKQLKGELGDRSPWMTFEKNISDAVKKLKEGDLAGGIGGIGDAVTQFTPAVKAMGDQLGQAFGFDTGTFDDAMQMLDGLGQGAQAAGQIMSGDFIGGAMSAVSAISSIGSAITNMIDRKHEKRIQELQAQIDKLEDSYKDLEKAVSRTYSFVKQKNIDLEIESKKNQIALIKQQIEEERDKKKTDHGKIDEWEKKIRELERDIEDLREAAVDAIFGEDVQSAIENFSSAYAEAWSNGEDRAKSAKETVKNMMKQMVTESIKSAIQASGSMERIRQKLQEFYADSVLSPWEQDYVMNMAERLQRDLDRQFGWADSLFAPDKSTSQDSTSRGFETMTQDQAAELNGRFTGIQMETSQISRKFDITNEHHAAIRANTAAISEGVGQLVELQGVAVSHLEAIERNTNELPEMNERLAKIEKNTRNL